MAESLDSGIGQETESSMKEKPTLLYVTNGFCAYGGGNCVLAWSLQGLREHWDITLFCSYVPDFKSINKHFGTSLEASDFKIKRPIHFCPLRHGHDL